MIYFLGIFVVVLVVFFYRKTIPEIDGKRKILLISLRSIAIITVLLLLLNPIYYFVKKHFVVPEIDFLNDVSASMNLTAENLTKMQALTDFKQKIRKKLTTENYHIKDWKFAAGLNGNRNSTLLGKSLSELAKQRNLKNTKAIFLFSDGWFKDENLVAVSALDIPIYAFSPNYKSVEADLEITDIKYNKTAYKDDITPIRVNIKSVNFKGKAKLTLSGNGKRIQSKNVDFSKRNFQQILFEPTFRQTGLLPFSVKISADSLQEINAENNRFQGAIQVLKNRSKILVVSDFINWDAKFILDIVSRNSHWEADFLLKNRGFRKGGKKVRFNNELNNAVTLVLINEKRLVFSEKEKNLIESFVKNGGGLLVMGKPIKALSDFLPASKSNISDSFEATMFFTSTSKQFQTFDFNDENAARNIPPVDYFYVNPKLEANILAKFDNDEQSAAILFEKYENGKVLYFAFLNFWKWQLWAEGNNYNRLMTGVCNWLSSTPTQHFIAFADKNIYFTGEKVKIRLNAYDEKLFPLKNLNAKIMIMENNRKVYQDFMLAGNDEYVAEISDLKPGKYKFVISDDQTKYSTNGEFIVSAANPESRDRGFNLPLLSYITEKTDGEIISNENIEKFSFPTAKPQQIAFKSEVPIYRKWFVIAIFLFSFSVELFLRKRWGLL